MKELSKLPLGTNYIEILRRFVSIVNEIPMMKSKTTLYQRKINIKYDKIYRLVIFQYAPRSFIIVLTPIKKRKDTRVQLCINKYIVGFHYKVFCSGHENKDTQRYHEIIYSMISKLVEHYKISC